MKWCLFFVLTFCGLISFAQQDSMQPPYKRFPSVPPFQILLGDSTTIYSKALLPKKTPVLLMVFSPDCSHCQHETEEILAHRDELKDVQIVMVTLHSIHDMKGFTTSYHLDQQQNIVVGKDIYFLLPSFFDIRNLPFHALYNKKGELIRAFEGTVGIEKLISLFNENN
jgi:thioredoxin-related protein